MYIFFLEEKLFLEEVKEVLIEGIEIIVLITLLIELLMFISKVFKNEKGGRSLMLLLLLGTVCVRDIMVTLELRDTKDINFLIVEGIIIFLVFIVIQIKEHFEKNS